MKLTVLASLIILVCRTASSQTVITKVIDSAAVTIITKVPFNGLNYFITIVPIDSTNIDNMPIYDPSQKFSMPLVWKDSLGRLLPDSITNYIKELNQWRLNQNKRRR